MKIKSRSFILVIAFAFLLLSSVVILTRATPFAQIDSIWQDLPLPRRQQTDPTWAKLSYYRVLEANLPALQDVLNRVAANEQDALPITLPLPDGTTQPFRLQPYTMLDPALAARYPDIQTFKGQSLEDPTATVRLDWTRRGLNAIILSSTGTFFITPFQAGDTTQYIVYSSQALPLIDLNETLPTDLQNFLDAHPLQTLADDASSALTALTLSNATLRTYRLAVAATGEYTEFYGGTVADTLAAITTLVNQTNAIYERELAINFTLVANNDQIIFLDPDTDPYTGDNKWIAVEENPAVLNSMIGITNYDVGHVVGAFAGGVGYGGACNNTNKARGASGSTYLQYGISFTFAHELGHQFTAYHTFNADNAGACIGNRQAPGAYEPGGGTTIMSYNRNCAEQSLQEYADMVFHTDSFERIISYVNGSISSCGTQSTTNNAPIVDAGPSYTIPKQTPFILTGMATDPNGDTLTYSWEQFDLGAPPDTLALPNLDDGSRPIFRSYPPDASLSRTFPSFIYPGFSAIGEYLPTTSRLLTFRFTARDQVGGVAYDTTTLTVSASAGPFTMTSPIGLTYWLPGSQQTITWNVANTSQPPINCTQVDILLSSNNGQTFDVVLAQNLPNNGSATLTIPEISPMIGLFKVACSDNIFFAHSDSAVRICTDLWHDDHEQLVSAWQLGTGAGNNPWQQRTDGGFSGQNYWYVLDANDLFGTDSYLTSPLLQATADQLLFGFYQRHQLEAYQTDANDAGVVEIQINGGSWMDVGAENFLSNGYSHTVRTDTYSALSGRPAFSGIAENYYESLVDLSSLLQTGDIFRLRFREANDYWYMGFTTTLGWFIDDVTICGAELAPEPTPTPIPTPSPVLEQFLPLIINP